MKSFEPTFGNWIVRKTIDSSGDHPFPEYSILSIQPWGPTGIACVYQNPFNAQLMASSLEMLEVLIDVYQDVFINENNRRHELIRQVIKKATGLSIDIDEVMEFMKTIKSSNSET